MHVLVAAAAALTLMPPAPAVPEVRSRPIGTPSDGQLLGGVQLPAEGDALFTWDWGLDRVPSRGWRRWGTSKTVATTLGVLAEYRAAHPGAGRVGVADLSRPHGGVFDERFGGAGHSSHQNGLDVDVLYPRRDGLEKAAIRPAQVDRRLAQDLVRRFVRAGAQLVFVGSRVGLTGPAKVVEPVPHHNDHLHVRFRP